MPTGNLKGFLELFNVLMGDLQFVFAINVNDKRSSTETKEKMKKGGVIPKE